MTPLGPGLDSGWPWKDLDASLETYQVGAYFEAADEGVLMTSLDSRYSQVRFTLQFLFKGVSHLYFRLIKSQ